MMSLKSALLAGILLCSAGCHGHGDHGHGDHGHGDHGQTEHDSAPEGHGSGAELTLDAGKKWPVDEPTRESATKMAALLAGNQTLDAVEDARTLGTALDAELDTLVRRCTMTGPAHDQLHVFLMALIPNVEALKEKPELADLQQARDQIGELFEAYASHFE